MPELVLAWSEAQVVAHIGAQRKLRALARGRRHRYGYNGADNWTANIEAAGAEATVAKYLDRYWSDSAEPDASGDVGTDEVRWTPTPDRRLIVHPTDRDDARIWLVTGELPRFTIHGWISGADAKNPAYWDDPTGRGRPAFFVPRDVLSDER